MKRPFTVGLALAGAIMAALPATALSLLPGMGQSEATVLAAGAAPPGPPMVIYGAASGIPATSSVIVLNSATGATCGRGSVVTVSGATNYVAQVYADSQVPGCGTSGASMSLSLYFSPSSPGTGGRIATVGVTWSSGGSAQQDATPGAALPIVAYAPMVARDGVQ